MDHEFTLYGVQVEWSAEDATITLSMEDYREKLEMVENNKSRDLLCELEVARYRSAHGLMAWLASNMARFARPYGLVRPAVRLL